MRKLVVAIILLISFSAYGQSPDFVRTKKVNDQNVVDARPKAYLSLNIPHFPTWTLNGAKDSTAYVMYNTTLNKFGVYVGLGVWKEYATVEELNLKVDKVTGKSLLSDSEITRLLGLSNYNDAAIVSGLATTNGNVTINSNSITDLQANKVDKVTGSSLLSNSEITRLSGMATGATANSTDGVLRDRTTHTGVQAISTVTGLQASLTLKENANQHKYLMGNFYKKLYTQKTGQAHVKWLTFGDSYAQLIYTQIGTPLSRVAGGFIAGAYFNGTYAGVTGNAVSGSVTENVSDFDGWVTGLTTTIGAGGSKTYGFGGSTIPATTIKVYYIKEPSAGTFKVQVNGVDATGYTNVSAVGTLGTLGVITITQAKTTCNWAVVGLTGSVRIIGAGFEDSSGSGLITVNVAQGGIPLGGGINSVTGQATALQNFNSFLADVQPTVMSFEMKENSSYYATALSTLFTGINTNLANTDVLLIGSPPIAVGDADQVIQNTQLESAATTFGYKYYDTYSLFKNYATLVALGWQGDGTHITIEANQYRGNMMFKYLGFNGEHEGVNTYNTLNDKVTTKSIAVTGVAGTVASFTSPGGTALTISTSNLLGSPATLNLSAGTSNVLTNGYLSANGFTMDLAASTIGGTNSAVRIITGGAERWRWSSTGNLSNTGGTGTAGLHLKAGTATANTAPLKLTSGVNLTTPEVGAVEFDGTNLFYTDNTLVRRTAVNLAGAQPLTNKTFGAGNTWQGNIIAPLYLGTGTASASTALFGDGTYKIIAGINNQTAVTQTAGFKIDGAATVGTLTVSGVSGFTGGVTFSAGAAFVGGIQTDAGLAINNSPSRTSNYKLDYTSGGLQIKETNNLGGVILAPMTQAQRLALTSMSPGAEVYQTDAGTNGEGKYIYQSTGWVKTSTITEITSGYTISTKTANYTETATSGTVIIKGDTNTAGFTITLPTAVGNKSTIIIKKTAALNTLTVNTTLSQTIDTSLTAVLTRQHESITLVSDNTNWIII